MKIETKADIALYGLLGLIALAHWYIDIYEWIIIIGR